MRKLHYLKTLFLSAMILVSACDSAKSIETPAAKPVDVIHENQESQISPQTNTQLAAKPEETSNMSEHAPLLDVSHDAALQGFGGGGGGGSSHRSVPYIYPVLGGGGGGGGKKPPSEEELGFHMLAHWNEMAIDASGRDHNLPGMISTFAVREQMGPGRASRALAIAHIAMFEVINAIKGGYESYVGLPPVTQKTSIDAAIAVAAYDTLSVLFPSQDDLMLYQKSLDMQTIPDSPEKERGIELGHQAAELILAMRADDGSNHAEPIVGVDYFPSDDPGIWRKDPISNIPLALGANWSTVTPFVMTSADQFRAPVPPALDSPEYAAAFNEVKQLGGDGIITPTTRTQDQTDIGLFWAYDGVPSLCAPPRLYNQIAMQIAKERGTDMLGTARLLALINVAMADAAIAVWESKYFYQVWRPVTGIREADPGTGPSLIGDNNPLTTGDINFSPLGAPASNISNGVNFTPPFPAYPSGHAGFGGAIFQIMRKFFGTDDIAFTFVSEELNGETLDNEGNPRPLKPRSFGSLSQAEEENGQSRIYLGIHWSFDKTGGITQGNQIADYLWDNLFKPVD